MYRHSIAPLFELVGLSSAGRMLIYANCDDALIFGIDEQGLRAIYWTLCICWAATHIWRNSKETQECPSKDCVPGKHTRV